MLDAIAQGKDYITRNCRTAAPVALPCTTAAIFSRVAASGRGDVVAHVLGLARAGGDGAGHGVVGEDEFQQQLGPAGASDLVGPGRQRPGGEAPQQAAAAKGPVHQHRHAARLRQRGGMRASAARSSAASLTCTKSSGSARITASSWS